MKETYFCEGDCKVTPDSVHCLTELIDYMEHGEVLSEYMDKFESDEFSGNYEEMIKSLNEEL